MGSVVVLGLEVGIGTGLVPSVAVDRRAVGTSLGGLNGEPVIGELGVGTHVNARHVPEDGVTALGVLELEHVGLVGLGGQLDGDTTAVAVGLPWLRVGTAARREGLHVSSSIGDRPRVDVVFQVVDDFNTAAATASGGGVAGLDGVGESCSESSESSSETELGEDHFEGVFVVEKKKVKVK